MKTSSETDLVELLFQLLRLMKKKMMPVQYSHLSILQIHALVFLEHHENVPMSEIAECFHIELPSATSLLNKLFEQGLVSRHEDPKDRRLVRVALTAKGKTTAKQAHLEQKRKLEKILSYLSAKEKKDLRTILKTLNNGLQS